MLEALDSQLAVALARVQKAWRRVEKLNKTNFNALNNISNISLVSNSVDVDKVACLKSLAFEAGLVGLGSQSAPLPCCFH